MKTAAIEQAAYTYIEYIQNSDDFRLSYFKEHETEREAKLSCIVYNMYCENQHYYIGLQKTLVNTLKRTTKTEIEYIADLNRFLNSIKG